MIQRHTYTLTMVLLVIFLLASVSCFAQKDTTRTDTVVSIKKKYSSVKDSLSHYKADRKQQVKDSLKIVEKRLLEENDSLEDKNKIAHKDSLIEIQHALRIGVDIIAPLTPLFGNKDDRGWQLKTDFRLTPRLYAAADFGYSKRTLDFSIQTVNADGWFARAGIDYSIIRGIFSSDDMMYVGVKLGYSQYDRHIYGDTITNNYWGDKTVVDIQDKPSALWMDLSVGVMVQVVKNVYLSMEGGYDIMLSSKKPNGIGPMLVPGMGQVYNNSAGFSFAYTVSYRIPLYKKTHHMRIRDEHPEGNNQKEKDKKKEKNKDFEPAFKPTNILEE
ncbi:MAG: DUF6048 family protein [Flavobacteriales bacterium]|nr:DUF6048 family protein [Flavobacteriales bacterium]